MFKEHHPKEKLEKMRHESIDNAIARGVVIEKIGVNVSGKNNKSNMKIDYSLIPKHIMDMLKKK